MTISGQALTLLSMALCGFLMGILYDTYRTFERMYKMGTWLIWICDLLFWTSSTFLVFGTLLRVNEGIVRIYIFLGIGIGIILYLLTFREIYGMILKKIIQLCIVIYKGIIRSVQVLVIVPILYLYKTLFSLVKWILRISWMIGKWICNPFIKIGKSSGKWVGNRTTLFYQKMAKSLTNLIKRKKI